MFGISPNAAPVEVSQVRPDALQGGRVTDDLPAMRDIRHIFASLRHCAYVLRSHLAGMSLCHHALAFSSTAGYFPDNIGQAAKRP